MKRPIERISTGQLTMLSGGVFMGTVFLPISSALARVAGSDSTLALIIAVPAAALFAHFVVHPSILAFPRKGLVAQFRLAFGEVIGRLLAAAIGIATIIFEVCLARQIADVYILSLMPRTPAWVFSFPMLFLCTVMAREGIEVLARYSGIVFPIILLMLFTLVALTIPSVKLGNFLPLFEFGLLPPLHAMVRLFVYAGEMILLVWAVLPSINKPRTAGSAIMKGALVAAIAMIGINFVTIGLFSAPEVARLFYATVDLSKTIQSGGYVRGVESIVIGVFSAASVLKISAYLMIGSSILSEVLGRSDYRPFVIPLAAASAVGIILLHDAARMIRVIDFVGHTVMLPVFVVLPPVVRLLAGWRWRRRRRRTKAPAA